MRNAGRESYQLQRASDATHIVKNLITIAENRKDAVVFASPERSDVVGSC